MLRRKSFTKYDTFDNVVPPLNTPTPALKYPQFVPEISSFQYDNFLRSAHSYSTVDYQMFTNSLSYSPNHYRKAIYQGIDLFSETAEESFWIEEEEEEEDFIDLMKPHHRAYGDFYGYNEAEGELDSFLILYTPYRVWSEVTRWLGSVYYYITGEQVHNAIFMYYYFYYYFLFTEYMYEHFCLYFPAVRLVSEYQLFSTFEGTYFNFYEIILGCYLPVIFFFYFSQYYFFKSFYTNKSYFIFGNSMLFYFFSILPVYILTGYSTIFILFTFSIFFCIVSAFYIFEFRPIYNDDPNQFSSYSSYFLPVIPERPIALSLPIFYFRYMNWPNPRTPYSYHATRKPFTRFPFNINVKKMHVFLVRKNRLKILEFNYSNRLRFVTPPSIPIMGLAFPKFSNIHAYSFKSHKNYIIRYPTKEFIPYSELQDHEYYNEIDQEEWPIHVRDFMNHPGGFSNISFLEFVLNQKSFRSIDYQFSQFFDEERDFYNSIPSRKFIEFLYPYAALKFWLNSIGNMDFGGEDDLFRFKDITFRSFDVSEESYTAFIPNFLKNSINFFFSKFSEFLDFITFYKFFNFSTPVSTGALAVKLVKINTLLTKDRRISYKFYRSIAIFLFRALSELRQLNILKKSDQFYYFTFLSLLRQFEEIYFNLNQKQSSYSPASLTFRYIGLCLKILKKKIDGFDKVVV